MDSSSSGSSWRCCSVASYFEDNAARLRWLGYVGLLASAALLVFVGSVRGAVARTDRTAKALADIGFAGGVAASAFLGLAMTIVATLAARSGASTVGSDALTIVADINLVGLALPVAFAVFCAASGWALARANVLPGWFGWISLIAAVAIGSPAGYILLTIGLAWSLVVAVWLTWNKAIGPAPAA